MLTRYILIELTDPVDVRMQPVSLTASVTVSDGAYGIHGTINGAAFEVALVHLFDESTAAPQRMAKFIEDEERIEGTWYA